MSSLYENIYESMSEAKASGSLDSIKEALVNFADSILNVVSNDIKSGTFSEFILDEKMIFKSTRNIFSKNDSDVTTFTTGLIDQELEMCGIENHENISDDIIDSINNLHSKLSTGNSDIATEKNDLINKINVLISSLR